MGEDLPDEWPELDPAKFYCLTVDQFFGGNCNGGFDQTKSCCRGGDVVITWIDVDADCTPNVLLCPPGPGGASQRLRDIKGPYDNLAACQADCP